MIRENFTAAAPGELVDITDELGNKGLAFLPQRLPVDIPGVGGKKIRLALLRLGFWMAKNRYTSRESSITSPEN